MQWLEKNPEPRGIWAEGERYLHAKAMRRYAFNTRKAEHKRILKETNFKEYVKCYPKEAKQEEK